MDTVFISRINVLNPIKHKFAHQVWKKTIPHCRFICGDNEQKPMLNIFTCWSIFLDLYSTMNNYTLLCQESEPKTASQCWYRFYLEKWQGAQTLLFTKNIYRISGLKMCFKLLNGLIYYSFPWFIIIQYCITR